MSDQPVAWTAALPVLQVQRLDQVCDQFEAAWKAGPRPRIEDYLGDRTEPERSILVRELLLLDVDYRRQAGEIPQPQDYGQYFPTLDPEWLIQVLAAPAVESDPRATAAEALHPAKARTIAGPVPEVRRLRCPHCSNPIQLKDDRSDEVLCPACGGSFRIADAPQTTTTNPMRPLGKFQLLERVGVGACGAVWKARDTELGRLVALKIPHAGMLDAPEAVERFRREARAAAQLRHPGIVTVHEVQILDGLPVLISDFIDGVPLKDLLAVRRLTFRESTILVAQLAEALNYAHDLGLVHRDIKPANILLEIPSALRPPPSETNPNTPEESPKTATGAQTDSDLRTSDFRPLITDFGLALQQEAEVTLTQEGHVIGTPAYMSPEQAAGRGHRADRRSDVYSLGVILYEILCGELPFRGSKAMMLFQVEHEEPRPPRRINDRIPRDLETICLKCLHKDPGKRYRTARALAEDLRRYLAGDPIQARPVGQAERVWRWCRRNPAGATLVGMSALAALALVGVAVGVAYNQQLQGALQQLKGALHEAGEQRGLVEKLQRSILYVRDINLAHQAWKDANIPLMLQLLKAQVPGQLGDPDLRGFEWHYLQRLSQLELRTLPGDETDVKRVAFSPDGRLLASAGGKPSEEESSGNITLWDMATGQRLWMLPAHTRRVESVVFSPEGDRIASASKDGTVKVWSVALGQPLVTFPGHQGFVRAVVFHPDGQQIASSDEDQTVRIWDATSGQEIQVLRGHTNTVLSLAFSPDGRRLASGGCDHTVRLWDVASGTVLRTLTEHSQDVTSVAYSPDGQRLASGSCDHTVRLWNAASGDELATLRGHKSSVVGVAFSPDGRLIASASLDRTIKVWSAAEGSVNWTLRDDANHVVFSPNGRLLASASKDATVKLWDATSDQGAFVLGRHQHDVTSLAFSGDGRLLAAAEAGVTPATVRVYNPTTGQQLVTLPGQGDMIYCVAFSSDSLRLAWGTTSKVQVCDLSTKQPIQFQRQHRGRVRSVAFSPDGQRLVSGSADQTAKVWDVATGDVLVPLQGHRGEVQSVAYSPDGHRIATASADGTVKVWEATTGLEIMTLEGHQNVVNRVTYSPDGLSLASASKDATVKVWDAVAGQLRHTLRGHTSSVAHVAFSPDGARLASAGFSDRLIKIWDTATGQEILSLNSYDSSLRCVVFSPDGRQLASAGGRTVRIWDGTPLTPERAAQREALSAMQYHFARLLLRPEALEAIRADVTLSDSVRQRALELATHAPEDVEDILDKCWELAGQPGAAPAQYQEALHLAEAARRLAPRSGDCLSTLGMVQYRAGKYRDALATLAQAEKINALSRKSWHVKAVIFLALTHHQLGQPESARHYFERLGQIRQQRAWSVWAREEKLGALVQEVDEMMKADPKGIEK